MTPKRIKEIDDSVNVLYDMKYPNDHVIEKNEIPPLDKPADIELSTKIKEIGTRLLTLIQRNRNE